MNSQFFKRHSRRTFVKELAFGAVAVGLGTARVSAGYTQSSGRQPQGVLSGTEFDLRIGAIPINITGSDRTAFAINGSVPAPLMRWLEGDSVTLRVTVSPSRHRNRGAGTEPLMANAVRSEPVMLIGI